MFAAFAFLVAFGLFAWWFLRRSKRLASPITAGSERLYLLIYDGSNFDLVSAEWADEGKHELRPLGSDQAMPFPRGAVTLLKRTGLTLGVLGFSQEVLAEHALMRRAREAVDLTSLFVGGGEPQRWMRWAQVTVPVLICIILWWQMQGAFGTQAALLQSVGAIKSTVDAGLECKVKP